MRTMCARVVMLAAALSGAVPIASGCEQSSSVWVHSVTANMEAAELASTSNELNCEAIGAA
jgi:hypothetical protein